MTEPDLWLINWFKQKGDVPGNTIDDQLQVNYFETKLIDSLGVVELITELEDYFGIRFNEEHFQDRRFSIIGGLSDLVKELLNSNRR